MAVPVTPMTNRNSVLGSGVDVVRFWSKLADEFLPMVIAESIVIEKLPPEYKIESLSVSEKAPGPSVE